MDDDAIMVDETQCGPCQHEFFLSDGTTRIVTLKTHTWHPLHVLLMSCDKVELRAITAASLASIDGVRTPPGGNARHCPAPVSVAAVAELGIGNHQVSSGSMVGQFARTVK